MGKLRNTYLRKIFILFAGITFLNMSFVLAEFEKLGLNKNSLLIQNVINAGIEEENETPGESGESETLKVYLSLQENLNHHSILFLIGQQKSKTVQNLSIHSGYREHFSPPPDVSVLS